MSIFRISFLFLCSAFLFGCASGAKMENMTYRNNGPAKVSFDPALNKQVDVQSVSGGEKTNPAWTSEISNESFSLALKRSLDSFGLFSSIGKYKLDVQMLDVDQPLFGLDMTVTTRVRYHLVDTVTNKVLIDEVVRAPYTASVGDAFLGSERLRKANEGSGKKNIQRFIEKLSELNVEQGSVSLSE
ncbi:hypothetical protein [uncultured Amphritea sp.]|uniref:hypothetical protein n=1 Tax=uncultured Amphritea sp. TaxID=981605 RepID=UPI002618DBCB|nr:hypothetical protein [uncultured Amphritea sp.]